MKQRWKVRLAQMVQDQVVHSTCNIITLDFNPRLPVAMGRKEPIDVALLPIMHTI